MGFPAKRYWCASGCWVAVIPVIFTVILEVQPVLAPAYTIDWYKLLACVVATALTWWNAARLELEKANAANTATDLLQRLVSAPDQKREVAANLTALSSDEVRARVRDVTQRMRAMEASFRITRDHALFEGAGGDWGEHINRIVAQGQEQRTRWQMDLKPEALALWEELRRRVYGAPPYPSDHQAATALEHGMLAGVSPLDHAASSMERLARQLP